MSQTRTWTRSELPPALNKALEAAIARGARAPTILRLTEVAGYTDWVLLLSARSERQVRGIVGHVRETLASGEPKLLGSDGLDLYLWALLDYDEFLVHTFYHPVRKHYDLESMWSDAPRVELELPEEVMSEIDLDGLAAPDPMPNYRGDMSFGGFDDEFVDDDDGEDEEDAEFVDDDEFGEDDGASFDEAPSSAASETPPPAVPNPDDELFDS